MTSDWKTRERAINECFMAELRAALARKQISITQAADSAGFTQGNLSRWLNGEVKMSAARFVHICETNDIDPIKTATMAVESARDGGHLSPLESAFVANLNNGRHAQREFVSDDGGNVYTLAAREDNDDAEAEAQTRDA